MSETSSGILRTRLPGIVNELPERNGMEWNEGRCCCWRDEEQKSKEAKQRKIYGRVRKERSAVISDDWPVVDAKGVFPSKALVCLSTVENNNFGTPFPTP